MRLRKKIGFLGCGNMGGAILSGLLRSGIAECGEILIYDTVARKASDLRRKYRVGVAASGKDLVSRVNVLVLAVKPQDLEAVCSEIRDSLDPGCLVITILAGVPMEKIYRLLGRKIFVARGMPNLGAFIGESVTAVAASHPGHFSLAEKIFSGCGRVLRLPEKYFDLVTALSGSGPAYFFYLMELLIEKGKHYGLSEKDARLLITQTAKGSALLACASAEPLDSLRKRVTSKGGTTEAALRVFESRGLPRLVAGAVENALNRAIELGRR